MEALVYFGLQTELKWQHEAAIVCQKRWLFIEKTLFYVWFIDNYVVVNQNVFSFSMADVNTRGDIQVVYIYMIQFSDNI